MEQYIKEELKIPLSPSVDVVVAGGGIAGISAALAAARSGAEVLLIEKQCILGGLATAGLVTIYLPLCDGRGNQMSYGIAEELFHLSISQGAQERYPKAWLEYGTKEERSKQRFEVQFNPQSMALLTEELLLKNGVEILYDTRICSVHMERDKVRALVIENKSGRSAVCAAAYVDATGDADLYWLAHGDTEEYKKKNTLAGWYYQNGREGVKLRILGFADAPADTERDKGEALLKRRFSGLDGKENSELLFASHKATLEDIRQNKLKDDSFEPVTISTIPQVRMTRRLCGEYTLKESENDKQFEDSIGMVGDWRKRGMVYEIPFRCLYSGKIRNLIGAGRCVSVDDGMWDIIRAIPGCAVTGEAAGIAAAQTCDFSQLDRRALQDTLRKHGQKIHFAEAGLESDTFPVNTRRE